MDKIDLKYLNEIVGGTEPGEVDTQHDLKVHEEHTTIEELEVDCRFNAACCTGSGFCLIKIYTICE